MMRHRYVDKKVLNSKEEEDFVTEHLLRKCSVDFSWLLSISLQLPRIVFERVSQTLEDVGAQSNE